MKKEIHDRITQLIPFNVLKKFSWLRSHTLQTQTVLRTANEINKQHNNALFQ